jgi:hypothetical protein
MGSDQSGWIFVPARRANFWLRISLCANWTSLLR